MYWLLCVDGFCCVLFVPLIAVCGKCWVARCVLSGVRCVLGCCVLLFMRVGYYSHMCCLKLVTCCLLAVVGCLCCVIVVFSDVCCWFYDVR